MFLVTDTGLERSFCQVDENDRVCSSNGVDWSCAASWCVGLLVGRVGFEPTPSRVEG